MVRLQDSPVARLFAALVSCLVLVLLLSAEARTRNNTGEFGPASLGVII